MELTSLGVVETVARQGSRPRILEWVASELAPHAATNSEVEDIYQAILGRIAGEA